MATGTWAPFKELATIVNLAIGLRQPHVYYALDSILKKHKPDMYSLLKNPAPNQNHHLLVQKANQEGLTITNIDQPLFLPQDFIEEALLLSKILNLNELASVELLLAGERHQSDFPTLSRGLVAVLLYYDGRRNLVTSLRSLIQARDGISWTLGLTPNVVELVTSYTDSLFKDGLFGKIIKLLKEIDVEKELENLSKGRAIKDSKHRQQIVDLINETKQGLCECLFYWSCQCPLPKKELEEIITELKKVPVINEDQRLDSISVSLLFALLASFRISDPSLEPVGESNFDSSLSDDQHYPFHTDPKTLTELHKIIKPLDTAKSTWSNTQLEGCVKFAWAVFLRECTSSDAFRDYQELEDDELLLDESIELGAFQFLRQCIIRSKQFFNEEYYIRCLHHVIVNYIHLMPVKITELRNHGDEVAREEVMRHIKSGGSSLKMKQNFGEFMLLIGDLYTTDPNGLGLALDYWPSTDSNSAREHMRLSLYKFINHCSDLLPPSLFHSFIHMLIGLSSTIPTSRCCFELLKSNSPSQGGGGPSAAISFDHFFHSLRQYYIGLKQMGGPSHTHTGCAISPQEVQGLLIVLKLLTVIVDKDEEARMLIYDNQTWLPVASLFGLIGCPILRELKTQIFLLLAAFAKTPDIAAVMWNTLENSQVLSTSMSFVGGATTPQYGLGNVQHEGSIQIELEEIETAAEEYSETRAFLALLDSLIDSCPLPLSLGINHRIPGFQPYLDFVQDVVLLKFDSRGYKDPQEKWLVASSSLNILHKLLLNHELSVNDLIEQHYEISPKSFVPLPQQPGFLILLHLLNDSPLLRKVLFIVDECCLLLSDIESSTDEVAAAGLRGLKMIETVLAKQDEFLHHLRSNSAHSLMATPINEFLLGINPRTGKADYYITISRYVSFTNCDPQLPLLAVRILTLSMKSSMAIKEMVDQVLSDKVASIDIMHGFIEHLEWEESGSELHPLDGMGGVECQLKEEILRLLVTCVSVKSAKNIGHYLLGFIPITNTARNKKLSETILQNPGVLGSSKTCLHTVLNFVKIGHNPYDPVGCHISHPNLAQLCYRLLFLLMSHRDLSQPTLRYLRNNHDYFYEQIISLPFPWLQNPAHNNLDVDDERIKDYLMHLNQISWILRSISIELKTTINHSQQSNIGRLILALMSSNAPSDHMTDFGQFNNQISLFWSDSSSDEGRRKILLLLDLVDFSCSAAQLPSLDLKYFDQQRMDDVIRSCQVNDDEGSTYVDVKLLHKLLMNELSSLQGAAALSQKPYIVEEIHHILKMVVQRNTMWERLRSHQMIMEAWQQVVEILVKVINEKEQEKLKVTVLLELMQELMLKIEQCDSNQLTTIAQSVIFTLMIHLRQCIHSVDSINHQSTELTTPPLQSILRGLLNNILKCPFGMQRLRSYLYASLLLYLQMTQDRETAIDSTKGGLWRLEHSAVDVAAADVNILNGYGNSLMDIICRDACSGHDIAKMLALSILDSVLSLDKQSVWLKFISSKGYLTTITATLHQDSHNLQKMLLPLPESLCPLYVYESKMALLIGVASTSLGANELVAKGFVGTLSECKFIDQRSGHRDDALRTSLNTSFVPSAYSRYLSLFMPILRLLLTLLSVNVLQKKEVSNQVIDFISSHIEVFETVLKATQGNVSMAMLQEVSMVTSIISHCGAGQDWSMNVGDQVHSANLLRLQHHFLSLLPVYSMPQHWKELANQITQVQDVSIHHVDWEETYRIIQEICINVLSYCQRMVSFEGSDLSSKFCRIIFYPSLSNTPAVGNSSLPLSVVVNSLRELSVSYFTELEVSQNLQKKSDNLSDMTFEDMKQFLSVICNEDTNQLTSFQLRQQIKSVLKRLISLKHRQLANFNFILEHLLYILWCHLQFFLSYQPTSDQNIPLILDKSYIRNLSQRSPAPNMESKPTGPKYDFSQFANGFTVADIDQLKTDAVTQLNDSFFKNILDISDNHASLNEENSSSISFADALVRRIRKLLKLKATTKSILQL